MRVAAIVVVLSAGAVATWSLGAVAPPPAGTAAAASPGAEKAADRAEESEAVAWCKEHDMPEDFCTGCKPSRARAFKAKGDWCQEHERPESLCLLCHPDLRDVLMGKVEPREAADWCAEHAVPESKCTKCHPRLIARFKAEGDWCAKHGFPRSVCPSHGAKKASEPKPGQPKPAGREGARAAPSSDWCLEHAVPEAACTKCHPEKTAGFMERNDWCDRHLLPKSVCPFCDPGKLAAAPAHARGTVLLGELEVLQPGTVVHLKSERARRMAGVETGAVEAREIARTIECVAEVSFDPRRTGELHALSSGVVRTVAADLGSPVRAGQTLAVLDPPESAALRQSDGAAGPRDAERAVLRVRSPVSGIVVRREASIGRMVSPEDTLFVVSDLSSLAARLAVEERDLPYLRLGQSVELRVDAVPGAVFPGRITAVPSELDGRTRTAEARAEIRNVGGLLRAGFFGRARIGVGGKGKSAAVPVGAVQRAGDRWLAFVERRAGEYLPRVLALGSAQDGWVQVLSGLSAGERVVVQGSFLLKTEVLRSAIGAGCCEVELERRG